MTRKGNYANRQPAQTPSQVHRDAQGQFVKQKGVSSTNYATPVRPTLVAPKLRFSPYAMAKLQYIRDLGPTEISGFGIADPNDFLLVKDFQMIKQTNTAAHTEFDDDDLGRFLEEWCGNGYSLDQIARIWIHTHPVGANGPSGTDENTFSEKFGSYPFSVMYILTKGNLHYCRLQVNHQDGLRMAMVIPAEVDCNQTFPKSNRTLWKEEYDKYCEKEVYVQTSYHFNGRGYNNYGEYDRSLRGRPKSTDQLLSEIDDMRSEIRQVTTDHKGDSLPPLEGDADLSLIGEDDLPDETYEGLDDELDLVYEVAEAVEDLDIMAVVMGYEKTSELEAK